MNGFILKDGTRLDMSEGAYKARIEPLERIFLKDGTVLPEYPIDSPERNDALIEILTDLNKAGYFNMTIPHVNIAIGVLDALSKLKTATRPDGLRLYKSVISRLDATIISLALYIKDDNDECYSITSKQEVDEQIITFTQSLTVE